VITVQCEPSVVQVPARKCQHCGGGILLRRKDAKYCSLDCNRKAYNARSGNTRRPVPIEEREA
jgi:hypothetical protein